MPALPRTMANRGYVSPYTDQLAALQAQIEQPVAPAMSPEQAAQLQAENQRQYGLGLLGQLAGDQLLGNVGGQVFKQALAQRKKRESDQGIYDPMTGQFEYHPEAKRRRLEDRYSSLQQADAQARIRWEENQRRDEERAYQRNLDRQAAAERAMIMAGLAGMGSVKADFEGYDPATGARIVTDRQGFTYKALPNGMQQRHDGPVVPKATWDKQVTEVTGYQTQADAAGRLAQQVRTHPDLFGFKGLTLTNTPGPLKMAVANRLGIKPEELQLRALVLRDAAKQINDLYGAALSAGESERANSFLPVDSEDDPMLLAKLEAAEQWARDRMQIYGGPVVREALLRGGKPVKAPNPAAGAANAAPATPGVPAGAPNAGGVVDFSTLK